jgi:hypothetical protein
MGFIGETHPHPTLPLKGRDLISAAHPTLPLKGRDLISAAPPYPRLKGRDIFTAQPTLPLEGHLYFLSLANASAIALGA